MDKQSQCNKILNHMRSEGSITAAEAVGKYKIYRLAARVSDLKRRGHNVVSTIVRTVDEDGNRSRYAIYRLEK